MKCVPVVVPVHQRHPQTSTSQQQKRMDGWAVWGGREGGSPPPSFSPQERSRILSRQKGELQHHTTTKKLARSCTTAERVLVKGTIHWAYGSCRQHGSTYLLVLLPQGVCYSSSPHCETLGIPNRVRPEGEEQGGRLLCQ